VPNTSEKTPQGRPKPDPGRTGSDVATGLRAMSAFEQSKALLRDVAAEKRPYFKHAFANPYNLSLFVGGLVASVLTFSPVLAFVALGGEALWMLYAPESRLLRRLAWDPRIDKERAEAEAGQRAARVIERRVPGGPRHGPRSRAPPAPARPTDRTRLRPLQLFRLRQRRLPP
jgi:hypothetical protein